MGLPIFIFAAVPQHPKTGKKFAPLQPGWVSKWIVVAADLSRARELSKAYQLGFQETQRGACYMSQMISGSGPDTEGLLCVEHFRGQVSRDGVGGGQPTGHPQAQRGAERPDGALGTDGFQELGDAALDVAPDNMYGPPADGTWTDLVQGPGGATHEVQR